MTPEKYYWFPNAINRATERAITTGIRQKVRVKFVGTDWFWVVFDA